MQINNTILLLDIMVNIYWKDFNILMNNYYEYKVIYKNVHT